MDALDPKPGYLTTEFWVAAGTTIITAVVAMAALFGHVLPKDNLLALVPALAPIAAAVASAWYSSSRAKVKTAHYQALTHLNVPAPAVVSHGVVNVQTTSPEITGEVQV